MKKQMLVSKHGKANAGLFVQELSAHTLVYYGPADKPATLEA